MIRKLFVTLAFVCLLPLSASAQSVSLSVQAKQQLLGLATQLVQILNDLAQAKSLGTAYTTTAEFASRSAGWLSQMMSIQQQVSSILSSAASAPPIYTGSGGACPPLYRDLEPGMQGNDIADLQRYFTSQPAVGHTGGITGVFDPATLTSVQRFQFAYGIKLSGDWNTTGYGRVGPATRATIANVCIHSTPPINTNPSVPYTPPLPPSTTPVGGSSTGTLTRVSVAGQSTNTVTFKVEAYANSACTATTFTLTFGDGQQETLNFPASCSTQTRQVTHVYPTLATYSASLRSGTYQTGMTVSVVPSNYTLSLSAAADTTLYSMILSAAFNPGGRCDEGSYNLNWGDGSSRTITFSGANCSAQTKTYNHTYSQAGTYQIQASDSVGNTTGVSFVARYEASAGAGDPFSVLKITAEGAEGSTSISDSSPLARSLTMHGNAHIDADSSAEGDSSLEIDGSGDYVSAAASSDFNYGSGPFTASMWFAPYVLPAANTQAALMIQANSSATDSSLGGAGLILYGNKLAYVGKIGSTVYHPFYNNTILSSTLTAGTWYHAAVVRSGNTITLYLNGVSQGSITVSGAAAASTNRLSIGRYGEYDGNYFVGWIDGVDVAKNVARWTANFTPSGTGTGTGTGGTGATNNWTSGLSIGTRENTGASADWDELLASSDVPTYTPGTSGLSDARSWIGASTCPTCGTTKKAQRLSFTGLTTGTAYSLIVYPGFVSDSGSSYQASIVSGTGTVNSAAKTYSGYNGGGSPWTISFTPTSSSVTLEIGNNASTGTTNFIYLDAIVLQ